jgi:hypothetical protein
MALQEKNQNQEAIGENEDELKLEIEVEDDTPPQDRGRTPMPKEIVQELDKDELDEYSETVKNKIVQYKKVYHDERREKERALREQQEAITVAKKLLEENKSLKATLTKGEQTLVDSYKQTADMELAAAKKAYKEAYEAGDSEAVVTAQERLTTAKIRSEQINNYKPSLQPEENNVDIEQAVAQKPQFDKKTVEWTQRNTWYGHPDHEDMTLMAFGLHQKLAKQHGQGFIGSDEYWKEIDDSMKRRFPEMFENDESIQTTSGNEKPAVRTSNKPATVVAPASRSTGSKKVKLTASAVALAKRLNLTPEQYVKEVLKLENNNG